MPTVRNDFNVCLGLVRAIARTQTVEDIYTAALDALQDGLEVSRASILLFDPDGVMRFKAWRGLSDGYRRAVEGHTPWTPDTPDPQPIVVSNVNADPSLAAYLPVLRAESIAAMAFVPLLNAGRVIGKFMLYYDKPTTLSDADLELAGMIATQVAFSVQRTRAEEHARQSAERLRFALDAAMMGTWDWDLIAQTVQWSENLERIHGLPPGSFDGAFNSYERELHPDDRDRVIAALQRAVQDGTPYDVEYRIVAPDGSIRWVEGKGRVEYANGQPVRMTGVCMNVTRRKQAELERLEAAHEASRLKDDFLAVLSHELRTPLNAIVGWVQMLQSGELPPERTAEAVEVIGRNARLQAQLIEDILDVSRIIAGKLDVARSPIFVPQMAESALNAVRPQALAKQIQLTNTVDGDIPTIEGDARRLQQVLYNVLSNAVKFTPKGGRVHLSCSAGHEWVALDIQDSGVGIAPEFLPFVFDRFRQGDSRATRRHSGLGLGLAIARYLVERHGGSIQARSDGNGCGATFVIRLPLPSHSLPAPVSSDPATIASVGVGLFSGIRILIVDDHDDARDVLRILLEREAALVFEADSVAAATGILSREAVDVLIADIGMPGANGYDLIQQVKATYPKIIGLALTAYARPEDRAAALAAGFDSYHAKPFDAVGLIDTVARLLEHGGNLPAGGSARRGGRRS